MFLYLGKNENVSKYFESLKLSAGKDVFSNNKKHGDGYGFVILNKNSESFMRKSNPIYDENSFMDYLKGRMAILAHARLASETEQKRGWIDDHPFRIFKENETFYIAHNGFVDKKKIAEKFGINTKNLTDTETFAYAIQSMKGNVIQNIEELIEILHERELLDTLNLLCLGYDYDGKIKLCYYSDFNDPRENYLSLIEYKNDDFISVMSSTVAYYLNLVDLNLNPLHEKVIKVEKNKLKKMEAYLW